MNKFYKEYEMLSAYVDGELSKDEIKYIEEKLAVSKDLQQKFAELKRVKELTQFSFQKAAESPYFETKLLANLSNVKQAGFKVRRWIPVLGISLTTIVLMLFLRSNPDFLNTIIDEQKSKLSGLYTENLKPLFVTAGLTNEDVFNFAFYRKLPLDKERGQYLQLGSNEDGSNFFEIKTAAMIEPGNEFENFVSALNLNEKQKGKVDSILESYANEMKAQVLVNENNTVALSPKLWDYNKAIFADVMAYAKDCNVEQYSKIVPAGFMKVNKPQLMEIAEVVRSAKDSDYIFLTPDTIFVESFTFDVDKFKHEMKKMQVELKKDLENAEDKLKQKSFSFRIDDNVVKMKTKGGREGQFEIFIDTNVYRVHIPQMNFNFRDIEIPDMAELEKQIEAATKNLQSFTVRIPREEKHIRKFEFRSDSRDSLKNFKFDFSLPGEFFSDSSLKNNQNFSFRSDSLSKALQKLMDESAFFNQKDFQLQMKEFQKEMQRFREEMLKLQKDLQKEPKKVKEAEAIEI